MSRAIQDALLKVTKALPAAGAANYSSSIDLGATAPWPTTEGFTLKVSLPATPSLVDDKTVTLTVKDSADDSTFAAVEEIATVVVTGAGGAGAAAAELVVNLPPSIKRYIRVDAAVLAAGGDNTAITVTSQLLF